MEMKLELVPMPVTDIDRAKVFYIEKLGFNQDLDVQPAEGVRIVQLTPQGSGCSILLSKGIPDIDAMTPGSSKAVHLVVGNIEKARAALTGLGVDVSEITDHGRGVKSASLADPDGNTWVIQEMEWRSAEFKD
jgi:predicted lactoylglutathione lyase